MAECHVCHESTDTPFECSYCGERYCADHRLPENHACPNRHQATPPKPSRTESVVGNGDREGRSDRSLLGRLADRLRGLFGR